MSTLIKASVLAGVGTANKCVEYFNSDLWIFYAWGAAGSEKISYVLRSEAYGTVRDLTPPGGQKLYQIYGVIEDGTYIYCLCRTVASAVMQVVQISTVHAQVLKTTTYTPASLTSLCFYPAGAVSIFIADGLTTDAGFNSALYLFTPNTWSVVTKPTNPGTTCWANHNFHPTLYDSKIYFQFMSWKTVGSYGNSYLTYYDIPSGTLGYEIFEYSFDPKIQEGFAKIFTLNGLATAGSTLLAHWTIVIGASDTFPIDLLDTDYFKVYSFVVIKNLITGQWDQYQQLTEENWWANNTLSMGGTFQRGCYIFLKTCGDVAGLGGLENLYVGANWTKNGTFKNYYNQVVGKTIVDWYIPYNTINCYVPVVYYLVNGGSVDLRVEEINFFGVPLKPAYLTTTTQWDTYGFNLYANYRGYEDPTQMEIDIDTAAGANVVQRTVTTSKTMITTLSTDGLAYGNEYKWRCRFYDSCGYYGEWSNFYNFWVREKPTFNTVAFDSLVTQKPNLVIDLNDYGCPIDTISIEIKDATTNPHWHSGDLKAALYYDETTDTYIIPINTHGYMKTGVAYTVTTVITNTRGRYNTNTYNPTPNFATVAVPTGLTVTKYNGYMKLSWVAAAGATGYLIYKTIAGVRTYIGTTTSLYYNDLSGEMNTPIIYGVATYDTISQSADVNITDSIRTNFYSLICIEDLWNIYSAVPVGQQLGESINNNMEAVGESFSSKFTTGTGSVNFNMSQYDYLAFKLRAKNSFYIKVKNEVYKVMIGSFDKLRTRNSEDYTINISFLQIFDSVPLIDWYMA